MVQMSIMKKAGVNLKSGQYYVKMGDRVYNDITVMREWTDKDFSDPTGERLMNVVSTLISAATDEAKNGNNARFNITQGALKAMGAMILYGIPLRDQIALINQPIIKQLERNQSKKQGSLRTAAEHEAIKYDDKELRNLVTNLLKDLPSTEYMGIDLNFVAGGDVFEEQGKKLSAVLTPENMAKVLIDEARNTELSDEDKMLRAAVQIASLELYNRMTALSEYKSKLGKILGLNRKINGFKTVDEALEAADDMGLTNGVIARGFPFDIRYALTGNAKYQDKTYRIGKDKNVPASNGVYVHHITIQYLKQLREVNELSKINFLHRTNPFRKMWDGITHVLKVDKNGKSSISKENKAQLEKDLRSFVQIAAFKHVAGFSNDLRDTLSNALIEEPQGDKTIIAIVKELRRIAPNSPLVKYLTPYDLRFKRGKSTRQSIHTVEANSRNRMSDTQMSYLMNSFEELWVNPATRHIAGALIDYLIVKDSFQFRNRTISKVIPVSAMDTILQASKVAQKLMLIDIPGTPTIESVQSLRDLFGKFSLIFDKSGNPFFSDEEKKYVQGLISSKEIDVPKEQWKPRSRDEYMEALNWAYKKLFGYTQQEMYNRFAKLVVQDKLYQFDVPTRDIDSLVNSKALTYDEHDGTYNISLDNITVGSNTWNKTGVDADGNDILEQETLAVAKNKAIKELHTAGFRLALDKLTDKHYFSIPKYFRSIRTGHIFELVGRDYKGETEYDIGRTIVTYRIH